MDTAALEAFLAVARAESFSRAAEALHLTQPAVSKRIAGLESALEVRLFDRVGRVVSLTEAGRALLPRARRVLDELTDCTRELHNLSGRVEGTLALATSHHIGLHRLPPALRSYTARYPGVHLDLRFMASESAFAAVAEGEVELAIVTLPEDPKEMSPLESFPLWDDPLTLVIAADHPLARLSSPDPGELSAYPAILPDPGTWTRRLIDAGLAGVGVTARTSFTTNYLETIKMMVSVGLGWSVLPESMLGHGLAPLGLPGLRLLRHLGAVRHPGRTPSNAAESFVRLLAMESAGTAPGVNRS
ncbi:LysR family transcriptional regulator [Thioalbus denitrificans]|uniref:LysR family transcriptional regulator n=1 Tax=Thioalbus denitrificans TaxID=547122 RepID=A0A369CGI1_9GAMM|nr:LysR family transcriptional regulator [Thioalbus denitrificans]RCX32185.1 LysR family transcriptional regulator [Thioalbus denitrificans]